MFLTDPALRRIAARTGDVLPDHLWRFETATTDPRADLARLLHRITLGFNDNAGQLSRLLTQLGDQTAAALRDLRQDGRIRVVGVDRQLTEVLSQLERHTTLEWMLLDAYAAWRNHHVPGDPDVRHLLLRPGDPAFGVAMLRRVDSDTWLVFPDAEAAAAFDIPYAGRVVGDVVTADTGWRPTASISSRHCTQQPVMTYPLPACDDLATACRSLLRWWQLRHSAAWRSRTPAQLTPSELAALIA